MSVAEREIVRPHFQPDEITTGLDAQGRSLRDTRYLFFAGDTVDEPRKRDLKDLEWGGVEVATRCIVRGVANFIPRVTIQPLEIGTDPLPKELVSDAHSDARPNPFNLGLMDVPCLPGAHIVNLLHNDQKGIVEITSLAGEKWSNGEAVKMENTLFPPTFRPTHIRSVEEHLNRMAEIHTSLKDEIGQMYDSCMIYRTWGTKVLDKEHGQVKSGRVHNHQYIYSPKGRLLLFMLEQTPQDVVLNTISQVQSQMLQQSLQQQGLTPEIMGMFGDQLSGVMEKAIEASARIGAEASAKVLAETLAPLIKQMTKEKKAEK